MRPADWEAMKYCSTACRRTASANVHRRLETAIRELLAARAPASTICPADAARRVFGDGFREHMEAARSAARRLAHRDEIRITQKGKRVDPASFRGPIRLGRGPAFAGQQKAPPETRA